METTVLSKGKKLQLRLVDKETGDPTCKSERLSDVAIVEYRITNENCGIFESVDDPE